MFDLRIDGGIAHLDLNRPDARNAIKAAQWPLLAEVVGDAERGGARLLVLSGTGRAFCAGADFSDFDALRDDAEAQACFRRSMRDSLDRLRAVPIPTLARIDGACFGAGVALAMACDVRIAGPSSSFALPPAKLGLSYPQEDVHFLVSLVGPGQASRLLFGGATIDGAEAARIGLVELFEPLDFASAVDRFAASVVANSAASLSLLKRGIGLAVRGRTQDEEQDRAFDQAFGSAELFERLSRLRNRSARN